MKVTIVIDDDNRDQDTDRPWVAWVDDDGASDESGIGATPLEALADLVHDLRQTKWSPA